MSSARLDCARFLSYIKPIAIMRKDGWRMPNKVRTHLVGDSTTASPSAPNVAWLRVNRLVTFTTGLKIAELLEADRAVDGGGSGGAATV